MLILKKKSIQKTNFYFPIENCKIVLYNEVSKCCGQKIYIGSPAAEKGKNL